MQGHFFNQPLRYQFPTRHCQCNKAACDGCRSGAAVRLQNIAVHRNASFAQLRKIHCRTQGSANQSLNFRGTLIQLQLIDVPFVSCCGCARQHGIFCRYPAFAAPLFKGRHAFLYGGVAKYLCVAPFYQHRPLRVTRKILDDFYGTQFVCLSSIKTVHLSFLLLFFFYS